MYQDAIYIRGKSADVSRTQGVCHVILIYFLNLLEVRQSCAKFHHYRGYV